MISYFYNFVYAARIPFSKMRMLFKILCKLNKVKHFVIPFNYNIFVSSGSTVEVEIAASIYLDKLCSKFVIFSIKKTLIKTCIFSNS